MGGMFAAEQRQTITIDTAKRPSMLMLHRHPTLQFNHPLPYGAILHDDGVQFVVFSRSATGMRVLLYDDVDDREPSEVIVSTARRTAGAISGASSCPASGPASSTTSRPTARSSPSKGQRFDRPARLIDPYARALAGNFLPADDGIIRPPKCVVVDDSSIGKAIATCGASLSETIIYEMHVRGFTARPSSGVEHPGTYLGVIEKIPYLKSLGVTAVELMPVHEFPTNGFWGEPDRGRTTGATTRWRSSRPHRGYAAGNEPGCQVREFKQMVRALHAAGIEVILDVVFNHTAEGNELGPDAQLQGPGEPVYYMLDDGGTYYKNYSGCGNTVNGNHPIVREMIFHCLRHWVHNYHVDGFRFDLASILSRDRNGELVPNPPVVEPIAEDPLLADTQDHRRSVGRRRRLPGRLVRAAALGRVERPLPRRRAPLLARRHGHDRRRLATRLAGSSDLYQASGRQPYHSINFVTSHDGFTLNDLVTLRAKSTTRPTAKTTATATTTTTARTTASKGPTRRPEIEALAAAADQEHAGHAAAEPGRADAAVRRRMPPHAARQQQRLLPGQPHLVVRLEAGRKECRSGALL